MPIENLDTGTIFTQILILFILAAIGFVSGKTGYLPEKSGQFVSKLVMRITMPALIFSKMVSADFSADTYFDGFKLAAIAAVTLLLVFAATRPFTKLMKIPDKSRNVYCMQALFGNVIFFAFPLFQALFGDIGVLYALFFNIGNDILLWTLGVYLAGKHKGGGFGNAIKHIFNINMIAFIIGLVFVITGWNDKINGGVIYQTTDMIGKATSPLSMIFVGLVMAGAKGVFKNFGKKMLSLVLTLQKQLVVPVLAGLIMFAAVKQGLISDVIMMIAVMQLAMPIGTLTVSIAAEYDSDYEMAADNVFVSTLFSIITLPLIAYLLKLVL
ncbi:MAG: AEC family transporter [Ruminococcaceae bacterium]|nr:AEC family transporter [Oscillospiraceae bacterium]